MKRQMVQKQICTQMLNKLSPTYCSFYTNLHGISCPQPSPH